ncbi:MAG: hypothetical protein JSS49_30690 [Planctomycetes bacterium]|nr:hypothetical protein [Planctomycetota bacterium]
MLNRPTATWLTDDADHSRNWDPDRVPAVRLAILWVGMLLPLLAVALRMGHLQVVLQDKYADGFDQTKVVLEEIPTRHGRILAADGSVLAGEEERFDLQMNYRLIQQPADDDWLKRQALLSLDQKDRKVKQKVAYEKERVLERREELWSTVARLTQRDPEELAVSRSSVQKRIKQMREDVLRQRELRQSQAPATTAADESKWSWVSIWNQVRRELTEAPARKQDLVLEEEVGYHTILVGVDGDVKAEIEANPERYPGLRIVVQSRRMYPLRELGSPLVGSRTSLTADEARRRRQADPTMTDRVGDPVGRSGLELQYDTHLRGIPGVQRVVKNRRGEIVSTEVVRKPQHGRDLVLTMDVEVQRKAEQQLDDALTRVTLPDTMDEELNQPLSVPTCPQGGCIVAIDVHSGAILAAASAPRFDLNLINHPDPEQWQDLMSDKRKPFFSRATQMALAPGSVFKILTAVAALESGTVNSDTVIACRGYLDRPDQHRCSIFRHHNLGHGDTRLADALCQSCNVYFFTAARRMGPQPMVDWAARFGIGRPTGIDLPSEANGNLPAADRRGDTLGLAIGQSKLRVTPLQMVRAMAAIANGGSLVTPHLAGETGPISLGESPSFRPAFTHPEPHPIEGLHGATLAHIREGLEMVVNHPRGTAFKTVHMNEVRIAGKTGTAEAGSGDHAWFAGYVPAERPRVAFVVVLEQGGSGGKSAGPVARNFVRCLLDLGLVTPATNLARE